MVPRDLKEYLKQIYIILGKERGKVPVILFFFLISSIIDVIGIGIIAPYVALIIDPELFAESRFYEFMTLLNITYNAENLLIIFGVTLFFVFVLKSLVAFGINNYLLSFSAKKAAELSKTLMRNFQNIDYESYTLRNTSEYIYSIVSLSSNYSLVLQAALRVMSESTVALVIFIFLAYNNILILTFLLLIIIGAIILYDYLFRKKLLYYGELRNKAASNQILSTTEGMTGLKEIRLLGKESYFHSSVEKNALDYAKFYVFTNLITTSPRYFLEVLLIFFVVTIVIFAVQAELVLQSLIPVLALFGFACVRLAPIASQLMIAISSLRVGRNAVDLLYKDLEEINCDDGMEINNAYDHKVDEGFQSLRLNNVSYRYPNVGQNSCDNISLSIKNGESVGIIGPSGSGKTTLIDIILGLLKPTDGEIIFNDINIRNNLAKWQSQIAYLPQEIFIIDSSIERNITLTKNKTEINQHELYKAISKSKLNSLLNQLPDGIETILGDKGVRLSGGQRQRIALARAFYHKRNILVLDEATSSLDIETEGGIMKEILGLKGENTLIIITHRIQTVQNCDRIYKITAAWRK